MSCCKNDLGSFAHNKAIETGITATQSGIHELMFTGPNGVRFTKYLNVEEGEDITIPAGLLNEDFQYGLVISQPDGTSLEVDDCPNFALKTYVNTVTCDDIDDYM